MTDDAPAWAVWLPKNERSSQDIVVAVNAADEDSAIEQAKEEAEYDGEVSHVDGPYEGAEASVFEFEFRTEHRERVVVEAPFEEYAKEEAQRQRDYRGELIQTVHTDVEVHPKEQDEEEADGDA